MSSDRYSDQPNLLEKSAHTSEAIDYRSYPTGTTIIAQGDSSKDVYTLIEGRAIAIQDGVKVGEINQGEIFGAIAAFTRSKRRASVVATRDCVVRAITQDAFANMMRDQPELAKSIK